ncbi:tyrosine--tRNA ligase [bacterium (Candidatus Moisslbacteria) CG12_big_fil_rev_8_21_14_0_65_36_11]|nr:tyrosine--tRNA ligase [Candidatus Kuenenbacteria bacterium]OIP76387.1 MAG: tyrosine--tRNA ligase [Parcubacteria group bacterium CG2_30_36_38]PIV45974.1 MAG: tyrosine--tRNA ligase [bacterium (Candidatus Moisslbacteria) CG02_land_8_20_14_3_00_36_53]PIW68112.1 MAG: tyrosine--tRNA ligase [bacterium (Candidatus Moisslbacteria) CG12_big_fil_rev_8_21_14_0_65_36_11]PIZ90447.1 MAG: tyrosine--tRNA ligase [bacterium (Candidatus Moisslbacteria) CG_4_10_14_0_2_um_filter_36_61]PJC00874.1 MAG: tyrosine--t
MNFDEKLEELVKGLSEKREIVERQEDLFLEKTVEVFTREDLTRKIDKSIKNKKPLVIKHGIDPTSNYLHLGHYISLRKLRILQRLGHQIVFLIGDLTAQIGDPSDKTAERKPLTEKEVKENIKGLRRQIGKALSLSSKDKEILPVKIVYNSQWLKKMPLSEFLSLTSLMTVSRMLERDNFAKRFKENKPISIREFLYPFLQGYDSVELKSDIEIGGTDQTFNMLAGRQIEEAYGLEPQAVITLPLLLGTDGRKMSKSLGNCISLADSSEDVFGKIMSIPDNLLKDYFYLLTDLSFSQWRQIRDEMRKGYNPKKVKEALASILVANLFSPEIAKKEKEKFNRLFAKKVVTDKDVKEIFTRGPIKLIDLLNKEKIIKSKSEARRLISSKAIKLIEGQGQIVISNPDYLIEKSGSIFKIGKRIFIKVIFR